MLTLVISDWISYKDNNKWIHIISDNNKWINIVSMQFLPEVG